MPKSSVIDPFAFLTEDRIVAFNLAIRGANNRQQSILKTDSHIYDLMDNWHKSFDIRAWFLYFIVDAFSDDDNARKRIINNVMGIEFDETYFVHFTVIELEDPHTPFWESHTVKSARNAPEVDLESCNSTPKQLILDGFDIGIEDETQEIPLSNLYQIKGGYIRPQSKITDLYFIDQDEYKVKDIQQLPLSGSYHASIIPVDKEVTPLPEPEFKLKIRKQDKDAE